MNDTSKTQDSALDAHEKPLRILFGCDTLYPDINGAARFTERLAAGLAERGHDIHLVAPAYQKDKVGTFTETIEGVPMTVHRLPSNKLIIHEWVRFVWPWMARKYARQVLAKVRPDVVHIQSHIVIGKGLASEVGNFGIPMIATNHIMPENIVDLWSMPKFMRQLVVRWGWNTAYKVLRNARVVTTPTQRAAGFLESSTPCRNVLAISCGIDAGQYFPILSPRDTKRLVFVGRMTQEKHIDVILEALAKLSSDVHLDLVGQGDQSDNLRQLAERLGVAERVVFHGKSTDEHLRQVLSCASVFTIASIAELQSIATMEAMASGLPIIAANAMALPHLVDEGVNGYLFEPGNVDDLVAKIELVLNKSPEDYLMMQQASLRKVEAHDITKTLDSFERIYRGSESV